METKSNSADGALIKNLQKGIGLYVHIPFCVRKCLYCDFCSVAVDAVLRGRYVDALIAEIESYRGRINYCVNSIFFGGGTPSILSAEEFVKIVASIRAVFDISENCEFTVEANPRTLTSAKLEAYKSCGVNRLSIGMQSIHEKELKKLGRIHTFEDFFVSFGMARAAGFSNINVDLMYGIPGQTLRSLKKTVNTLVALSPEHISCYGLIIEENTPFFEMKNELDLPGEEEEYRMYEYICDKLGEAGYSHYEISNYAKAGFECRHNLKYWHDEEYIGIGVSSHSYFEGRRFYNSNGFSEYFSYDEAKYRQRENELSGIQKDEYIMLRLRLSEGIVFRDYQLIFGESFTTGRENLLQSFVRAGYAVFDEHRFALTEKGFYLSNSIISQLI